MELKYGLLTLKDVEYYRSNRTFMELKLTLQGVGTNEVLVLIVPLWN